MPGSRWRRVRLISLSIVLLTLVVYTGCDVWAGRRVAAEVSKLESRYGSLSGSLQSADVPPQENRARLVTAAVALLNTTFRNTGSIDRAELSKFMRDPAATAVPAKLRIYIDTNAEAIALARRFVTRPRSSFDVDYRYSGDRPNLLEMRNLADVLFLATVQAIERANFDDAASLVAAAISLSAVERNEPDLIGQLVRIAVADIAANGLQRLLEAGDPSRASLEELARVLAENREPAPMTAGLLAEMKNVNHAFSQIESGRTRDLAETSLSSAVSVPLPRLLRPFWRWAHAQYLARSANCWTFRPARAPGRPAKKSRGRRSGRSSIA